jgi:Ca-activated chloride channel family protein
VVSARVVRAVATLDDGRRLPVAIRTKGVTVSETSHVDSVTVTALVTDSRGRFVSGLTADDFRILDEGVPQKVVMLDAGQDGAEVVVALDLSGSMFPVLGDLQDVARDFLGRLRPVDKVTLAGFNAGFFVIAPRDATRAALDQAIGKLDPYGGTAIFDALIAGVKILSAQTGRRAIIMFSDGDDISSRASLESARAELHGQDVVLYLVATGKADSDPVLRRSLENLCEETGGSAFFAGKLSGTVDHFREIVDDMAKQYLLAFSPEPVFSDGKFRKISVEPKDKSLRIRARTGYFAAKR